MEINEVIKKRRMELGLTLKDVARELGTAESTISRYETNGIQNMGIDKILDLAKILKCEPMYLLGFEDSAVEANNDEVFEEFEENEYTDVEKSKIKEYADYLVSKRTAGSKSSHFKDVKTAKEYLKKHKMVVAFNGKNKFSDETIIQIANTIFNEKGNN